MWRNRYFAFDILRFRCFAHSMFCYSIFRNFEFLWFRFSATSIFYFWYSAFYILYFDILLFDILSGTHLNTPFVCFPRRWKRRRGAPLFLHTLSDILSTSHMEILFPWHLRSGHQFQTGSIGTTFKNVCDCAMATVVEWLILNFQHAIGYQYLQDVVTKLLHR